MKGRSLLCLTFSSIFTFLHTGIKKYEASIGKEVWRVPAGSPKHSTWARQWKLLLTGEAKPPDPTPAGSAQPSPTHEDAKGTENSP